MSTCASYQCPKYNECARASINVEGIHTATDKANIAFVKTTPDGKCVEDYWCGEKGNYRLFEPKYTKPTT